MMRAHKNKSVSALWLVLVIGALALSFLSCETLSFPDPNAPTQENAPISTLVTGTLAGMRIDYAIYLRVVSVVGREAYYFEPADPRYTGELLQGTPDPGGFLLNRPWVARYRVVADCRALLEKAKALTGAEKNAVEGFAKTIMAHQLLLNLNYTDDKGIKLDFSGDVNKPFASKAESFAFIENLLDEAFTQLNDAGSSFPFSLNSGFAGFDTPATFAQFNRGLRARVAVYQKKWQDALDALAQSFLDPTGNFDKGVYMIYGTGQGDQNNEVFEDPNAEFIKLMGHPSFETDAEPGDPRFSTKVKKRATPTTFDDLTSDLAVTITSSSTSPLSVIRNEELILLRAEANIGMGNLADAESDINAVRTAYGLAPVTLTDPDQALDQLLHEKRYSLFLEGHRWIDLRRYGKLNTLPIDRPGRDTVLDEMPIPEDELPG